MLALISYSTYRADQIKLLEGYTVLAWVVGDFSFKDYRLGLGSGLGYPIYCENNCFLLVALECFRQ